MNHHHVHAAIEVANKYSERTEGGIKVAKAIAASEAFRKYDWLRNVPVRNVSGNLRGMVVSGRWATIFHFAEDVLKPIERVTLLAALAENIAKAHHQVGTILDSRDGWDIKSARLSTQVSSIAIRTVGGIIPAATHLLALSVGGYCQIAELAGVHGAANLDQRLKGLSARVTTSYDKITDGENISVFINTHLVIR